MTKRVVLNQAVETNQSSSGVYGEDYYDEYPEGAEGVVLQKTGNESLVKFDDEDLGSTWFPNTVLKEK